MKDVLFFTKKTYLNRGRRSYKHKINWNDFEFHKYAQSKNFKIPRHAFDDKNN